MWMYSIMNELVELFLSLSLSSGQGGPVIVSGINGMQLLPPCLLDTLLHSFGLVVISELLSYALLIIRRKKVFPSPGFEPGKAYN